MSNGPIGNSGDVGALQQSPVTSTKPESVEAKNPGYLNRRSITKLKNVLSILASIRGKSKPASKPIFEYKVTKPGHGKEALDSQLQASKKFDANQTTINELQDKVKTYKAAGASKRGNDETVIQLKEELKNIKALLKHTRNTAASGAIKLGLADAGLSSLEALTPHEVNAQHQFEQVETLQSDYKELLGEAEGLQNRFNKESKITKGLEKTLKSLEKRFKSAQDKLDGKRKHDSTAAHKVRVETLKGAKKDIAGLARELNTFAKKVGNTVHGAVSDELWNKLPDLKNKVTQLKGKSKEVLSAAKKERNIAISAEKKQTAPERKTQSTPNSPATSRKQSTETAQGGRRSSSEGVSAAPELTRRNALRRSASAPSLSSLSGTQSKPGATAGALPDIDLINQLKGVRGTRTNFSDLQTSLHSLGSVRDLKQVIADRHVSNITIKEQGQYNGLLKAAFLALSVNTEGAKQLQPDLVRAALSHEPDTVKQVIANMKRTDLVRIRRNRGTARGG